MITWWMQTDRYKLKISEEINFFSKNESNTSWKVIYLNNSSEFDNVSQDLSEIILLSTLHRSGRYDIWAKYAKYEKKNLLSPN